MSGREIGSVVVLAEDRHATLAAFTAATAGCCPGACSVTRSA